MTNVTLIACPSCSRNNNVQRTMCIYCGTLLPVAEGQELLQLPSLRLMEESELGFNVVFFPEEKAEIETVQKEIEIVTRLSSEQITELITAGVPLPIARTVDLDDAKIIHQRLGAVGVRTVILPDEKLSTQVLPFRVRKVYEKGEDLILWNSEQLPIQEIHWRKIEFIVWGTLQVKQVQITEANKLYGRGREIKDVAEYVSSDSVIDFFGSEVGQHYRIRGESFDYTCLGKRMKLLAGENFRELGNWIRENATHAVMNQEFNRLTHSLETIWPLIKTTERQPLKRIGIGKFTSESHVFMDNEIQFTRYARMSYLLQKKGGFTD